MLVRGKKVLWKALKARKAENNYFLCKLVGPAGHSAKAVETDLLTGRANSAEPAVTGTRAEKVRFLNGCFMVVIYG